MEFVTWGYLDITFSSSNESLNSFSLASVDLQSYIHGTASPSLKNKSKTE